MSPELDLSLQYMQSRAFNTRATEVLYGGAAGGGKSHLIRVATIAWACEVGGLQVYLFRRLSDDLYKNHMTGPGSYTDLLAPLEEARMAKWNGSKNFWDFWNGSRIWLCHCQYEKDVTKYQGAEIGVLCVGTETGVLMADGTYKPAGEIKVGEQVQTLKGPKRVNKVFPRRMADCVEVDTGKAKQVHPKDHKVLTPWGWHSYGSLYQKSMSSHGGRGLFSQCGESAHNHFSSPENGTPDRPYDASGCQPTSGHWGQQEASACSKGGQNCSATSCGEPQDVLRPQGLSAPAMLFSQSHQSALAYLSDYQNSLTESLGQYPASSPLDEICGLSSPGQQALLHPLGGAYSCESQGTFSKETPLKCGSVSQHPEESCHRHNEKSHLSPPHLCPDCGSAHGHDPYGSEKPSDWKGYCSSCHHQCDAPPHFHATDDREFHARLSNDAVILTCPEYGMLSGDQGLSQPHTHPLCSTFSHPYKMGEVLSSDEVSAYQVSYIPCGYREVVDMEIDEVNHYITKSGLVNCNCLDEGTHFTAPMYRYLRGRVRMGSVKMPPKYKGLFPRILIATNPGGVGHSFFKKEFIDLAPPMEVTKMPKKDGGMLRQFIPAKLTDNPVLLENDPDYADRLESLGDPTLVRAMLEGDWNIVAGGALDDVWDQKLVLPRFPIPKEWKIDRAFDWGSTHPFSVGWWAVSNGEEFTVGEDTMCLPKGSLVNFHEWYGAKDLHENTGLRIGPVEIAEGILEREYGLKKAGWVAKDAMFKAGPADNQIFNVNDTESDSIGDKMKKTGVEWILSDKKAGSRINGLQLLRERMRNVKDGRGTPGIYFMEHCRAAITTLPVLPRDRTNPEDVDTNSIDHAYDQIRYRVLHEAREYAKSINIQWSR